MNGSKKVIIMWGIFLVLGIILMIMQIYHTSILLKKHDHPALKDVPKT